MEVHHNVAFHRQRNSSRTARAGAGGDWRFNSTGAEVWRREPFTRVNSSAHSKARARPAWAARSHADQAVTAQVGHSPGSPPGPRSPWPRGREDTRTFHSDDRTAERWAQETNRD